MKKILRFIIFKIKLLCNPVEKEKSAVGLVVKSFDKGGLERVVLNLYKGLLKKGIPAYIIITTNKGGEMINELDSPDHFRIINGSSREFYDFCIRKNIRILHYHYETFCMRLFKKLGFSVYYTLHSIYCWFDDEQFAEYTKKLKHCDKIFAVSDWVRNYFCKRSGMDEKVITIFNGTDVSDFKEFDEETEIEVEGINEDDIAFINVASISPTKHQLALLSAFEKAREKKDKLKLIFAGNVLDKKYSEKFFKYIEASQFKEDIVFLGHVEHKTLARLMQTVPKCMVLSSINEGFSIAMVESLMSGLPVITPDFDLSNNPMFEKAIITIPTAYDSIFDVDVKMIERLSGDANTKNVDALAEKLLYVAENHEKIRAGFKGEDFFCLSTEKMVDEHIREIFG